MISLKHTNLQTPSLTPVTATLPEKQVNNLQFTFVHPLQAGFCYYISQGGSCQIISLLEARPLGILWLMEWLAGDGGCWLELKLAGPDEWMPTHLRDWAFPYGSWVPRGSVPGVNIPGEPVAGIS